MPTEELIELFKETRAETESICSFLQTEDFVLQPVEYVSPPKWHLAHTTWFFEEFILKTVSDYQVFNPHFSFLFNSYYESVGDKLQRFNRGNLSRPILPEIYNYRKHVTENLLKQLKQGVSGEILNILEIGIQHEKQHQELLLTDIKFILGHNPLFPQYNDAFKENPKQDFPQELLSLSEGIYEIGHDNPAEFCYDNEMGRHKVYLQDFEISNKLVTNQEYLEFIEDQGYAQVLLWHAEAWDWVQQNQIKAPLYWYKKDGKWLQFTLNGLQELELQAPLSHISYFEAFAFSQWKKMRLPTEFEWEVAQKQFSWGSRWEWTQSAYLPYPGYTKPAGALGEYNGKFMVNQKVLRGSSVASPQKHIRPTYRNFFHPQLRWQFTGIRLAK